MNIRVFVCIATLAASPAVAQDMALEIDLIPGHAVYHESEREAGVAMALSITPAPEHATYLIELCEELRLAAGLGPENGGELRLETIFVVPYKAMAVEGFYLPRDDTFGRNALVRGKDLARATLDGIVARAGIPPSILDEKNVEHEVSCVAGEPTWFVAWSDVRQIGDEEPEAVIARAHQRFLAIHQSVLTHSAGDQPIRAARGAAVRG